VPFADLDALSLHQLRRTPAGPLTPVPLLVDGDELAPSPARPSARDAKWLVSALPAVAEFLDEHWAAVTEMVALGEKAKLSSEHVRSGVKVCWPPPTRDEYLAEQRDAK